MIDREFPGPNVTATPCGNTGSAGSAGFRHDGAGTRTVYDAATPPCQLERV